MTKIKHAIASAVSVAALFGSLGLTPVTVSADDKKMSAVEEGKKIAFNRKLGNCLGCHQMDDGALPGNIGPPLIAMKARYPDKAKLRAQIYDATVRNPHSAMPPFGRHGVLTDDQIDKITEYVHTL